MVIGAKEQDTRWAVSLSGGSGGEFPPLLFMHGLSNHVHLQNHTSPSDPSSLSVSFQSQLGNVYLSGAL